MDFLNTLLNAKGDTPSGVSIGQFIDSMSPEMRGNAYNSFSTLASQQGKTLGDIYNYVMPSSGLANANQVMDAYRSGNGSNLNSGLQQYYLPTTTQQSTTPPPTTTPASPGLTMEDLSRWWTTAQDQLFNRFNTQMGGSMGNAGGDHLGNIYPRANWGNYQNTNRGARYFNPTTGNYQTNTTLGTL